jgi:hypothetical protein
MKTFRQFQESAALKLISRVGLPAARSAINALSSSQRIKAGLKAGEALSKTAGKVTKGGATATSVRAARAVRAPIPTQEPGKYLKMQQAKRPTVTQPKKSTGLTHTVRAVESPAEKAGQTRYPGLKKYTSPVPVTKTKKKPNLVGPAIAAGAGTLAALDAEKTNREMQRKQKAFEEFRHNLIF